MSEPSETIFFDTAAPTGNKPVAQWQTPHLHDHHHHHHEHDEPEPDFDLVEQAFADSFPTAADPTSFLRLAGIPFIGLDAHGRRLCLLRVEYSQATDVGSVTPHLGGGPLRYDPLPAHMTSRRDRLSFVYQCDGGIVSLGLVEAKALTGEVEGAD